MANIFSSDSSCKALWTFEGTSASFTDDKIGGNDFSNINNVLPDMVTYKEGVQAANIIVANLGYLSITDASLDAGFPFRDADGVNSVKDFTICSWINFITTAEATHYRAIFSKYDTGSSKRTIMIRYVSNSRIVLIKGYNSGASEESDVHLSSLDKSIWYHLGVGYRESDKSYYIHIWDDNAGTVLGTDVSSKFIQNTSVEDRPIHISHPWDSGSINAHCDELIVFNKKKTLSDVDKIRSGTYNYKDYSNLSLDLNTQLNMLGGG